MKSNNYFLVAKGGLGGVADAWIKIEGEVEIEVSTDGHQMPLRIKADNALSFAGFGQLKKDLTGNPYEFIEARQQGSIDGHYIEAVPVSKIWVADKKMTEKDDSKIKIDLSTHSITFKQSNVDSDTFAKSDYVIKNTNGNVLVKVEQIDGAKSLQLGGQYGNNHPQPNCAVYLDIQDLIFEMTNTGDVGIEMLVHSPNKSEGEEKFLHRQWLVPGQTGTYHMSKDVFKDLPPWHRAKKVNNNDYVAD